MIVTAVERTRGRRSRVDIYVDGALLFDVARDTAADLGLRQGRTIDAAEADAIVVADQRRQALATAAAMLARRPRSEREIQQRLAQRRFAAELIDATVSRLRASKLIDDAEFARVWTESRDRSSPRGQRLIVQELRGYGVEANTAQTAAAAVSDADAAYRVATKRVRALTGLEYRAFRDRLGSFLQRRGFGWDVARETVERCWRELGGGPAAEEIALDDLADRVE